MNNTANKAPNKAVFLDRDGTLIEEQGYICHLSQSRIFPFAFDAVRRMNEKGYMVIGITNQSSIARGICTVEQVETIHTEIQRQFLNRGCKIERFYYCPYHEEAKIEKFRGKHSWRKPSPGMLLQAAKDFDIDLSASYLMGDHMTDIQAGLNAGCKTVLVLTGKGEQYRPILEENKISPGYITGNIFTAVDTLL